MSWNPNNNSGGFAPPSGPPPGNYGPSPAGFPFASPGGFSPGYGGPPPFGAPPGPGGFAPPSGPPPPGGSPGDRGFPGAQYHQSQASTYPGQQQHGYTPPTGPPPGQGSPFGPPGGSSFGSPYGPPPGPPPPGPPPGGQSPGYGGQAQNTNPYASGPYAPPPSAPLHMPPRGVQHYGPQFQGANSQTQQPYFEYSMCNGRRKALLIGINYPGTSAELRGCVNDVQNVKRFLCTSWGYKEQDIVALTDDARNPRQIPTKVNIMDAMRWLVQDARPNDSLFFHYSGHGGQTKDLDGDEDDGYDEVIYPTDFETNGHIVDDDMHAIMVAPLPAGCRLTAIFDSCHSGSALDLPYIYSTEGKLKEPNLVAEAGAGLLGAVTSYARGDMGGVFKSAMSIVKTATGGTQKANEYAKKTRTSPADVISFSGCKDSQTSADTVEAGQATGAMSFAFIAAIQKQHDQSYQQLLNNVRDILRSKYSQKPQLSSSHPMDTTIQFIM